MATDTDKKAIETGLRGELKKAETAVVNAVEKEVLELHAKIDAWFAKHFHNNRISQDEVTYGLCHTAKEDLKTIIAPVPAAAPPVTGA